MSADFVGSSGPLDGAVTRRRACTSVAPHSMAMARHGADGSLLGAGTRVIGRVSGAGAVRIEGAITGDVSVTGPAEIGAGASIDGDLSAESIDIAGRLVGDAVARGAIAVRAGAEVRGDVKAGSISIEPGSKVDVRLDTEFSLDLETSGRRR
jgi:cytoskeletal protein CcmA (bactofilin family)